jgi:hypothetical protein
LDARWSIAIAALWIAFSILRAGDLVLHSIRLWRLWESALPVEDIALAALESDKRVQVCTTRNLDRPSVIGFFAPRILIPDWLYARLTPGELDQVVLHELEHLNRRDDWTNLLQKLGLVLFPLNPVLVWIERRLCREREMACDEGVVRITQAPRSYAACLASLAERRLERRSEALSLGAFERRSELVHRVQSILLKKNVLGPVGARALLGAMGFCLLFGSIELARCPQIVAFEPAPRLAQDMAQADSVQQVPVAYRPTRDTIPSFRAINAEAIVPNNALRPQVLPAIGQRTIGNAKTQPKLALKSTGIATAQPRQQLIGSKSLEPKSLEPMSSSAQTLEEWVVLTTWQVQSPALEAGQTADYDTAAKPKDLGNEPSAKPNRITVTRLILQVYSQNPPAASAPAPDSNSTVKPALHRSAALPFDSGWLVIQL